MEKVISEWRIVETDDGFRIEIKGDKEALRRWMKHRCHHGPMHRGPMHGMKGMRFGPWGIGFGGHGPWGAGFEDDPCCCSEESEEEHEEQEKD